MTSATLPFIDILADSWDTHSVQYTGNPSSISIGILVCKNNGSVCDLERLIRSRRLVFVIIPELKLDPSNAVKIGKSTSELAEPPHKGLCPYQRNVYEKALLHYWGYG